MPRQPDPITVLHPSPVLATAKPGSNPRGTFVAARTPVRLRRRDPGEFEPIPPFRMGGEEFPRRLFAGPGGIWRAVHGARSAPAPLAAVRAWLAGDALPREIEGPIRNAFTGTPVAAYGCGGPADEEWRHEGFRGHAPGTAGRILRDDAAEGAAALREWLDRDVALVGQSALVRYRPLATLRPLRERDWCLTAARRAGGFDLVVATPHTWEAVDALWGEYGRDRLPEPRGGWRDLAAHWEPGGDEDVRYLLNLQAAYLARRIELRHAAIRGSAPESDERVALERMAPAMARMAHRAALGLAGSAGHEADLDLFRGAVAIETRLSGRGASRTGISVLHRYLVEVVGSRTLSLPRDDEAALDGLAPGA